MTAVIDGFRWSLLGQPWALGGSAILSFAVVAALLIHATVWAQAARPAQPSNPWNSNPLGQAIYWLSNDQMVKELGYMFKWFRDVGYGADIPRLKTLNPDLKDFKTWLAAESAWKRR